jgi:hypothetical protein
MEGRRGIAERERDDLALSNLAAVREGGREAGDGGGGAGARAAAGATTRSWWWRRQSSVEVADLRGGGG